MDQFQNGSKSQSSVFLLRWLTFSVEKIEMDQKVSHLSKTTRDRDFEPF